VSVGFALYPHDARGPQQLLAKAGAAAREGGRHAREQTGPGARAA
jgi:hypothetical protein